jgi:hypothetical protein
MVFLMNVSLKMSLISCMNENLLGLEEDESMKPLLGVACREEHHEF